MPPDAVVRLPFAEQIAFFRGKLGNLIPTETWREVLRAGHDRGFMVAGAAKADLLADLAGAVDRVTAEGKSIAWFRQEFDSVVGAHGWAYRGERNWRTRVIYQTNLSTSYAAGRLAQLRDPELQKLKPYWMYRHSDSVTRPRPLHVSWDGLVLPADHPWWQTHYPPNGWGCKCRVVAVSREEALRQGGRIEDPPDDGIDAKTGAPAGIDEGWDYMPGHTRTADVQETVAAKLDRYPPKLAVSVVRGMAREGAVARWLAHPEGEYPLAVLPDADLPKIGAQSRVVRLSPQTLEKQADHHPELTAEDYALAQEAISGGRALQSGDKSLVYVWEDGALVTVVKATAAGDATYLTSLRRLSRDAARQDKEIRRLERRGKK